MSFQPQWSRIPLRVRWVLCLAFAALCVVLLVIFVDRNDSSGEVTPSAAKLRAESAQSAIVVGQEQTPVGVRIPHGASVTGTLAAAVRHDMAHQIYQAEIDGPLQHVNCVIHGGTWTRTGYHCVAEAANVNYPFLAVVTPHAHHAWFCEKVYPPLPSENIPVTKRCQA